MIDKVNSGDRLRISAHDWNEIADSVNNTRLGAGSAQTQRGLYIYNGTDRDLRMGLCLKAGGVGNAASENYADMLVVPFVVPSNNESGCMYIVTAEDIHAGDMGRVVMSGPCYALFSAYDVSMQYAVPDGNGKLRSSSSGDIRVVYADAVKKQGVVLIGVGGGAEKGMFDLKMKDRRIYLYNSIEYDEPDYDNPRNSSGVVQVPSRNLNVPELSCGIDGHYIGLSIAFSHDNTGVEYTLYAMNNIPTLFDMRGNSYIHNITLARLDRSNIIHRLCPKGIIRMDGVWA